MLLLLHLIVSVVIFFSRYNPVNTDEVNAAATAHNMNGFIHGWML